MPRHRSFLLVPSEWKVMRIVWRLKACAARDVCAITEKEHGWAVSTTKTILARLADKGYLTITPVGNSFLYRPTRSALKSLCDAADALLENALDGTTGPLLAHMLKNSNLTDEEIAQLQDLLDEFKERPESKS